MKLVGRKDLTGHTRRAKKAIANKAVESIDHMPLHVVITQMEKHREACIVLMGGSAGPFLTQESEIRGVPVYTLAQQICEKRESWMQELLKAEADRIRINMQVDASRDIRVIAAIAESAYGADAK